MGPKWDQKSPKGAQVAPKIGPKWTLKAKLASRASQRPPDGHFWNDFGAIFNDFLVLFVDICCIISMNFEYIFLNIYCSVRRV